MSKGNTVEELKAMIRRWKALLDNSALPTVRQVRTRRQHHQEMDTLERALSAILGDDDRRAR